MSVRPVNGYPSVISTSQHVMQGMADLSDETWDPALKILSGKSKVVANDPYELRVCIPQTVNPMKIEKVIAGKGAVIHYEQTARGATVTIVAAQSGEINWKVKFNQYKNTVCEVDAYSGKVRRKISLLREPVAGVLSLDEKYLFVSNFLPAQRADVDHVSAEVSVVDLKDFSVVKNIRLANGSNALRGICVSPDGLNIYISHNLGRFQVPTTQLQQGWMNASPEDVKVSAFYSFSEKISQMITVCVLQKKRFRLHLFLSVNDKRVLLRA
ncbi:MAG: hypothetical protein PHI28_16420 [Mangrovibacterium sp.]|nr:hypothetical protein [Mangrovibacterium sp.]